MRQRQKMILGIGIIVMLILVLFNPFRQQPNKASSQVLIEPQGFTISQVAPYTIQTTMSPLGKSEPISTALPHLGINGNGFIPGGVAFPVPGTIPGTIPTAEIKIAVVGIAKPLATIKINDEFFDVRAGYKGKEFFVESIGDTGVTIIVNKERKYIKYGIE